MLVVEINKQFYIIPDESIQSYKNIDLVVESLVEAGLTRKVARLKSLAVIKGN